MVSRVVQRLENIVSDEVTNPNETLVLLDTGIFISGLMRQMGFPYDVGKVDRIMQKDKALTNLTLSHPSFYVCPDVSDELTDGVRTIKSKMNRLKRRFHLVDFRQLQKAVDIHTNMVAKQRVLDFCQIIENEGLSSRAYNRDTYKIAKSIIQKVPEKKGEPLSFQDARQFISGIQIARHTNYKVVMVTRDGDLLNVGRVLNSRIGYERFKNVSNFKVHHLPMYKGRENKTLTFAGGGWVA